MRSSALVSGIALGLACGAVGSACDASVDAVFEQDAARADEDAGSPGADASFANSDATASTTPNADGPRDAGEAPPGVPEEFHVPGTQFGDVPMSGYIAPAICSGCHVGNDDAPYPSWKGSLMASAGRDPLFFAQLATASQDVPGVGTYCIRCHAPMAVVTGTVGHGSEAALTREDREGVTCHFCHGMVDPLADGGALPTGDPAIVGALADPPRQIGNAMFVLDPKWLRRGPYTDASPPHFATASDFVRRSEMCGTCHDVGNVRVARRADGTYQYVAPGKRAPDADPQHQFPLERTYTEWKLSAYADGGVDAGGLFGGDAGSRVVSSCQDCHMPRVEARGCSFAGVRSDLARHEFAGASSWVLRIIAEDAGTAAEVAALERGQANAIAMVQRSASLTLSTNGGALRAHVVNQSGHKIPTGHIEGRRMWVSATFTDATDHVLAEHGRWDPATGDLDEATTTVFEMKVGLSAEAALATGLEAGVTTHMAVADSIVKDNRIPPAGFVNATYEAAGAGAVGATYADGQNWADVDFPIPAGAKHARVTLWYQTVTREYIEALRDGNHTDAWGTKLAQLWETNDKGPPIAVTTSERALP